MTEPEEVIEARLIELLAAAAPQIDVIGALTPAPEGEQKLSDNTYIAVFADLAAPEIDWSGPGLPCAWSARVVVHWANADGSAGYGFRATCRQVREVLDSYLGLSCSNFSANGFECDDFQLSSTSTTLDADGYAKSYPISIKGRYFPPAPETTETTATSNPTSNP